MRQKSQTPHHERPDPSERAPRMTNRHRYATLAAPSPRGHRMTEDAGTPSRAPLQGDAALVRALGPFQLGASIVNIIVGAGIFMLPALLLARMGPAAPLAFVLGAFAIVPIALCFAAVGSRAAATGGPYTSVGAG